MISENQLLVLVIKEEQWQSDEQNTCEPPDPPEPSEPPEQTKEEEEEEEEEEVKSKKQKEYDENEEKQEKHQRIKYLVQRLRKKLPSVIRERRQVIDKNSKFASLCVLDAFQGRMSNGLATNSKKSQLMFTIFCIQTRDWFLNLVVFSSVIHTLMIFFEPITTDCSASFSWMISIAHFLIFLIHFLDVILKMIYQGFWEYLDHDWQFLYMINVTLHFFDLLYFHRTTFTNPLRPVIGLLRDRSFRRFFSVVKLMIPCLSEMLAPLITFLVVISVITNVLFSADYQNECEDKDPESNLRMVHYNWLWLVLTNDTFLRLFPESAEQDVLYVIFFFTVLYIGQRFILSVILGATFETFTKFTSEQVKKEKLKEYQGLTKAFSILDDSKQGYISDVMFTALMKNLEPMYHLEEIGLYYELISGGSSKGISILQFLSLSDVLSFKFIRKGTVSYHESKEYIFHMLEKYKDLITLPLPEGNWIFSLAKRCLEFMEQKKILMYSNWIDIFLLSFGFLDYPFFSIPLLPFISQSPLMITITPCLLMRGLNIFEFSSRILLKNGKLFSLMLEITDLYMVLFLLGAVGLIAIDSMILSFSFSHLFFSFPVSPLTPTISFFGYLIHFNVIRVVFRCFRIMRVFETNQDLASFMDAVVSVAPIFFQNMGFAFIVTYIFAMIGNICFGAWVDCFSSPAFAMITLLKLFLPVNFLDVLEEVMEKVHPISVIFFLTYFLMSIIISNLSLSIIIEWYSDSLKDKSHDKTEEAETYDHLFQTIVSRARLRRVFTLRRNEETFYDTIRMIKLSEESGSDHRLKFVEKGTTISKNDLKKCQKYSNIQLVDFYDAESKELKKLTWEADFIKELRELKIGKLKKYSCGENICLQGTPAMEGYILISGRIEIKIESSSFSHSSHSLSSVDKKKKEVVLNPLQFLGSMCLSPDGIHSHSCVATSDDVECFIVTRESIMTEIDQSIIGQLLRLSYKTNEDIHKYYQEKLHRRPLRLASIRT